MTSSYRRRLKAPQVANRLGMRVNRFYSWMSSYQVPCGYVPNEDGSGREVMVFSWPEVQAWLKSRSDLIARLEAERRG